MTTGASASLAVKSTDGTDLRPRHSMRQRFGDFGVTNSSKRGIYRTDRMIRRTNSDSGRSWPFLGDFIHLYDRLRREAVESDRVSQ